MNVPGDDLYEMRTDPLLTDDTVEAVLSGRVPAGRDDLAELTALVTEARSVEATPAPVPGARLAAILAGGLSTDCPDVAALPASSVPAPARQPVVPPKKPRPRLVGRAALAKAAVVLGGFTIATTGAAAAGVLPDVAQDTVGSAIERVLPVDIPTSADEAEAKRAKGQRIAGEHKADKADGAGVDGDGAGERPDSLGTTVSGRASSGEPKDGGFGEKVSSTAPGASVSAEHPAAESPAADGNPGTAARGAAPAPAGRSDRMPTAEDNPGTGARQNARGGRPDSTPAGHHRGTSAGQSSARP